MSAEAHDEKELITHSRKQTFNACRRRHFYAYELGIRALKPEKPLVTGDAMHRWLEAWFTWIMQNGVAQWFAPVAPMFERTLLDHPDSPEDVHAVLMSPVYAAFGEVEKIDPFEAAKLRAMVLAYHIRWRGQTWKILDVEKQFRTPLINPQTGRSSQNYDSGGKMDVVVEINDNDPEWDGEWVVEHKSTGAKDFTPGSLYWMKLRLDPQISEYTAGARASGIDVRGVIYDVVGKPGIEPLKATPEEKRKMTQGMGCKTCGGGKGKQGRGTITTHFKDMCNACSCCEGASACGECGCCQAKAKSTTCSTCNGTGWKPGDEPRWHAGTRLRDETPGEYGLRCFLAMAEDPDSYFRRYRVLRLDEDLYEHQMDGWLITKNIHETKLAKIAPRNTSQCFAWNRQCEYKPVCYDGFSIDDPSLYKMTGKHPELAHVVRDTE